MKQRQQKSGNNVRFETVYIEINLSMLNGFFIGRVFIYDIDNIYRGDSDWNLQIKGNKNAKNTKN
ncbi:uncharacterized protein T551_03390 [Pneumocystis jirovecii RU7]|uniref:Uncharacterized protein n=1 Tax=Pneumocystis jirovecii (strain RU7) TaxID=1408657 RepID=A0A0W4ZD19_PNEJ7|nr:uncharacterized protein T551_03606 [Pneumocystis jirovecii RU7]XP_018228259.1 uncharacterized protein T551_03390 [Pneumocystis jirovecii RU7]KTW26308.1 hypothetical protein T551_03606 [Pneumocystis jirovecii RU7]KTW26928.1 hypothetical protein T551_03390 [Pneumocystis jirovecii RU7]